MFKWILDLRCNLIRSLSKCLDFEIPVCFPDVQLFLLKNCVLCFRKASEGLKSINPDETAPSMRLLAYGKLELHAVVKRKSQT